MKNEIPGETVQGEKFIDCKDGFYQLEKSKYVPSDKLYFKEKERMEFGFLRIEIFLTVLTIAQIIQLVLLLTR